MKRRLRAAGLLPPALLASALALSACSSDTSNGSSATGGPSAGQKVQDDADVAFLTGMTPHHEQALEMSNIVLAARPPAAVAAIARQVRAAQAPEIAQMTSMHTAMDQMPGRMAHRDGHDAAVAGHDGMMSGGEMQAMMDATGPDAARLYLEGMIRHHEGAIKASDAQLKDGTYEPARALAEQIKQAQTAEITAMEALLSSL